MISNMKKKEEESSFNGTKLKLSPLWRFLDLASEASADLPYLVSVILKHLARGAETAILR